MLGNEALFGLVNNAGIAVAGPLLYLDVDELRRQLEVALPWAAQELGLTPPGEKG